MVPFCFQKFLKGEWYLCLDIRSHSGIISVVIMPLNYIKGFQWKVELSCQWVKPLPWTGKNGAVLLWPLCYILWDQLLLICNQSCGPFGFHVVPNKLMEWIYRLSNQSFFFFKCDICLDKRMLQHIDEDVCVSILLTLFLWM